MSASLDQLPDGLWQVAAAVTTALIEDACAAEQALEAVEPAATLTPVAMRSAVADPRLHRAAERCLDAAVAALPRLGAAEHVAAVNQFRERFTSRRRCPADDLLEGPPGDASRSPASRPADTNLSDPTLSDDDGRHVLWP